MKEVLKKLLEIQVELKAPKNQYNSFGNYSYRSCEDILEAVKPLCKKHGCVLTLTDTVKQIGDRYYIEATAILFDIETAEMISATSSAREPATKKGSDESQITGAASSYARKYALNGLFDIDDTKDADAEDKPTAPPPKPTAQPPKPTAQPPKPATSVPKPMNNTVKFISDAQRTRLFAMAKGHEDIIRKELEEKNISSTKEIPISIYDEICKKVEEKVKAVETNE